MILEEIKERRSIRNYLDKEIPEKVLGKILEAVRMAPSAGNRQPWKLILVKDKRLKQQVMLAAGRQSFVEQASVVVVGCALNVDHIMPNGEYSYPIDLAIALDHLSLQAVKEGLGTCWIGDFEQNRMKNILQIPEKVKIVSLMTLGYPAEILPKKDRKQLEELISFNYY